MAVKRRRRGMHPIVAGLLCVLFGAAAAGWNYVSYVKTKYSGAHPYWSRQAFKELDRGSLEYMVAEKVLPAAVLSELNAADTGARTYGKALAEMSSEEEADEQQQRKEALEFAQKFCSDPGKPCFINYMGGRDMTLAFSEELYKASRLSYLGK